MSGTGFHSSLVERKTQPAQRWVALELHFSRATCRIQLLSALVLSRRVSVYSLLLSASCSLAAAQAVLGCSFPSGALLQAARAGALRSVMGKKRRAFDDDADESEEDEISRHAEAAWLARRRAQQPPAPAAAAEPPRGRLAWQAAVAAAAV